MSNYARGRRCEYAARDELRARGYFVVRAAGSRGAFDLCALPFGAGRPLLVQCKRGALKRKDVDAILAAPVPRNAIVELWQFVELGRVIVHRRVGCDLLPVIERGE